MLEALAGHSAAEIEAGLYETVRSFCGTSRTTDDITYVVIKVLDYKAAAGERPAEIG